MKTSMKPFGTMKEAIRWAKSVTPSGRWVHVSVCIRYGREILHYRLDTTIVSAPRGLKTLATREF